MIQYMTVHNDDASNVVAVIDGKIYQADNEHPNWGSILTALAAGDESVVDLFDIEQSLVKRFEKVSERVSIANGQVYFDGEVVDNSLTRQVLRFLDEGADFAPLVKFFEKVQTNPNEHSREQLFSWLNIADFTIDSDGDIIGYKGVAVVDGNYTSISHGTATVDGVVHEGAIPNYPGAVVEMPRGDVQHDPRVGCHTGLHVGTWDYASGFARGAVLTVKVNPRDVVSVPSDCSAQKMRTCRYKVLDVTEQAYTTAYVQQEVDYSEDVVDDDEDDLDVVIPWWTFDYEEDDEPRQFTPNSSVIELVTWDDGDLAVYLHDGRVYEYSNVPLSDYESFAGTASAGRFWNDKIKPLYS